MLVHWLLKKTIVWILQLQPCKVYNCSTRFFVLASAFAQFAPMTSIKVVADGSAEPRLSQQNSHACRQAKQTNNLVLSNKQCFTMLLSCKHTDDTTRCYAEAMCVSCSICAHLMVLDLQASLFILARYAPRTECSEGPARSTLESRQAWSISGNIHCN